MAALRVELFGPGTLSLDDRTLRLHSARTLALLTVLVLDSPRPITRSRLLELLWPHQEAQRARQGLRQALHSIRRIADGQLGQGLRIDGDTLRWAHDGGAEMDLRRFMAGASGVDEAGWRDAAAHYQAPLLEGRDDIAGARFAEWLQTTRARLHAMAVQNLDRLAHGCLARSDGDGTLAWTQAMHRHEPTNESASRLRFRVHAERHDLVALDHEWAVLCAALARESADAPMAQTARLYRTLRAGLDRDKSPLERHPYSIDLQPGDKALPPAKRAQPDDRSHATINSLLRAARAAERVHAFSHAVDLYSRALDQIRCHGTADPRQHCTVLLAREGVLERLGRRSEQLDDLDQAAAIANGLGDVALLDSVLLRRAGVLAYIGRHEQAQAFAAQARECFSAMGDAPGQAEALREAAFAHWRAGQHQAALRMTREALAMHQRMGDVTGEATALHNLAEIHRSLGSPALAAQWFAQALPLHWSVGNRVGEILTLFGWARALGQLGDLEGAQQHVERALSISMEAQEPTMQARALHSLALAHAQRGEMAHALERMQQAVAIDRSIGYAHAIGHDLVELARLHRLGGDSSQVRVILEEALIWFDSIEDPDAATRIHQWLRNPDELPSASTNGASHASAWGQDVRSHLPMAEGKVYCAFESPLSPGGGA